MGNWRERYVVSPERGVRLSEIDTSVKGDVDGSKDDRKALKKLVKRLDELQYVLYAQGRRALLVVLQAMDTGGKDGTIRHVLGPVNPQGCRVTSFKVPSREELAHDYLWRIHKAMPERGQIGVFNRSHYEDVLAVRVLKLVPETVWSRRYEQINAFEKLVADNDVTIVKFYLHISKDEQKARLLKRIEDPTKRWKASADDWETRKLWDEYMRAYEDALSRTSTAHAPWYVVPADRKWYRNLVVASVLVETLETMDLKLPEATFDVSEIDMA